MHVLASAATGDGGREKRDDVPDARADDYDARRRRCARLAAFVDAVRREHPSYWCAPVPPFGPRAPRLLVVGLAPGMHGANATGRAFTGDYAGLLLYRTLHAYGYANHPQSRARDDDLALVDCRITNAVKCLPPKNRPLPAEIAHCNGLTSRPTWRRSPPVRRSSRSAAWRTMPS